MTVEQTVRNIRKEMDASVIEHADLVDGVILALLSRENVLAIGPPGTAKSFVMRLAHQAVGGSTYFEKLLTGHTKPDEVFGPVKLSALKQDLYRHPDAGYLQHAHVGFVDEVFKANSAILHGLLSAMNERIFHDGDIVRHIPLEVLMGASNELPKEEGLEAVFDRFLLRYRLDYIQEDGNFARMLAGSDEPVLSETLSLDALHDAQAAAAAVEVPPKVVEAVLRIRKALRAEGVIASDRRYKKSLKLVRARAWVGGRTKAIDDDLLILSDVLWTLPEQRDNVTRVVTDVANPLQGQSDTIMDAIYSSWQEVERVPVEQKVEKNQKAIECFTKVQEAMGKLLELKEKMAAEGRDVSKAEQQIAKAEHILEVRLKQDILKLKGRPTGGMAMPKGRVIP